MEATQDHTDQLMERLAALGPKDREAVLSRMNANERGDVENALNRHLEEVRQKEERQQRIDQQFLGYSPWLASIVEDTQDSPANGLSEMCSKALWEIHSTKVGDGMQAPSSTWQNIVDRINEWLSPKSTETGV